MEASENMKFLASWMSVCLDIELPDFYNLDATWEYISKHKKDFDELASKYLKKPSVLRKIASRIKRNLLKK